MKREFQEHAKHDNNNSNSNNGNENSLFMYISIYNQSKCMVCCFFPFVCLLAYSSVCLFVCGWFFLLLPMRQLVTSHATQCEFSFLFF